MNRPGFFERNPDLLEQMIEEYRLNIFSPTELGEKYGVKHSSIIYQVKKYGIWQKRTRKSRAHRVECAWAKPGPFRAKYDHIIVEKINLGKRYADYLKDVESRGYL